MMVHINSSSCQAFHDANKLIMSVLIPEPSNQLHELVKTTYTTGTE